MASKWSNWECIGGVLISAPAVSSWGASRLDVFVGGTDNGLWHKWYDGIKWRGFESLGGALASAPGAFSRAANLIDLVVEGPDNGLWQKSWNGTAWSSWSAIPPTAVIFDAPAITMYPPLGMQLLVWARGAKNNPIYYFW